MVTGKELLQIVRATGEIYGKQVSEAAAIMFLADLSNYDGEKIKQALQQCRRELKFFPSVAEVVARIPDGHPGVEEAWAMLPKNEYVSVVWTNEMAEAFAVCRELVDRDPIAARMAFKESYQRIVNESKKLGRPPAWTVSFGLDQHGRAPVIAEAVSKNRINQADASRMLPTWNKDQATELNKLNYDSKGLESMGTMMDRIKPREGK